MNASVRKLIERLGEAIDEVGGEFGASAQSE
jgi:hypothetical protein